MRADLEAAMAEVIGSRSGRARFVEDPTAFAEEFSLEPTEVGMLLEMGRDLTALTASFVTKRRGGVRWNARRTLALLGGEGERLVDEYVDEHPQPDSLRAEAAMFGEFMISRTTERPQQWALDRVIREMAVFERHRSDSFWDATVGTGPREREGVVRRPDPEGKPEAVRLVAGANLGYFGLDMRLPFRRSIQPWRLLPDDPSQLLFFHCHRLAQLRTLRLRPDDAEIVRQLTTPAAVPVEVLRESAPEGADVDHLLRTLSWEEAIEWA